MKGTEAGLISSTLSVSSSCPLSVSGHAVVASAPVASLCLLSVPSRAAVPSLSMLVPRAVVLGTRDVCCCVTTHGCVYASVIVLLPSCRLCIGVARVIICRYATVGVFVRFYDGSGLSERRPRIRGGGVLGEMEA